MVTRNGSQQLVDPVNDAALNTRTSNKLAGAAGVSQRRYHDDIAWKIITKITHD